MRRSKKFFERLAKLENALSNGNSPVETVLKAETPLEKKTLKVDFPLAEVPFPTKEVQNPKSEVQSPINLSEPSEFADSFAGLSEPPGEPNGFSAFEEAKTANVSQISDYKFQNEEKSVIDNFSNVSSTDISNLKSKFAEEQKSTDDGQWTTDEDLNPQSQTANHKSFEYIASMPVKMPPISSEDLEHFDEDKLDTSYENKLSRAGDNLIPIKNAAKIVEELVGLSETNGFSAFSENQNGSSAAAATAPAKSKPAFEIPNFDYDDDNEELPVLSENPTPEELVAYAQKHPNVKKVLRAFRGKIIEVKKLL